jgi:hypothetical protein
MQALPPSPELDPLAAELAAVIDAHAGDYPLVSFHDDAQGPVVTWLYGHVVVEVFIDAQSSAGIRAQQLGGVNLVVRTLKEGMELLRRTESRRQRKSAWPYVRLS